MLNLIKYNFLRKGRLLAIVAVCTILANLFVGIRYGEIQITVFLGIAWLALAILLIVDIILMYSRDLNSTEGYMLFMTPNSGYKILASKVATAILEGIAIVVFYSAIVLINLKIFFGNEMNYFEINLPLGFSVAHFTVLLAVVLVLIIQFILTIFTALTVRKSLLANVKFGGLISFMFFVILNVIVTKFYGIVGKIFNLTLDVDILNSTFESEFGFNEIIVPIGQLIIEFIPIVLISVVITTILASISGFLLEKKINL